MLHVTTRSGGAEMQGPFARGAINHLLYQGEKAVLLPHVQEIQRIIEPSNIEK